MEPWRIFNEIISGPWTTSGLDVQWTVKLAGGVPYLAFQGSCSWLDWLHDFCFLVKPYKNQEHKMLVHAGFARCWKSCNDEVMAKFIGLCSISKERPVITGHSMGGALSVLAAEDFAYRTGIKPIVPTFGAPKVAWGKKTKEYLESRADFLMFAQRNDPVPRCPPLPGYKRLNTIEIGEKFNFFKMAFNPNKWHQLYGEGGEYWT